VTIDGIWIGNRIHCALYNSWLHFKTHYIRVFSVRLFAIGFQRQTVLCFRAHVLAGWRPYHANLIYLGYLEVTVQVYSWKLRGVVISHSFASSASRRLKFSYKSILPCTAFPSTLVSMQELSPPLPVLLLLRVGGLPPLNTRAGFSWYFLHLIAVLNYEIWSVHGGYCDDDDPVGRNAV
jgi:hypothetical protein